jgi:hypothetical protein
VFVNNIVESSLSGKKPPEEIAVIARLRELNILIPNIFKTIKIKMVKLEYKRKILIVCFKISELLKDKKFVNDFFKLSS